MSSYQTATILGIVLIFVLGITIIKSSSPIIPESSSSSIKEPFIGVQQDYYIDQYPNQINMSDLRNEQFVSRPSFKPLVPPRFFNGSYQNELRGTLPPDYLMGVPHDPMDFSNMIAEPRAADNSQNVGNYGVMQERYMNPLEYVDPSEVLPSEDMSSIKYGKLASDPNVYNYDRLIYANAKRPLLQGSDYFRGDLPIVPMRDRGCGAWFSVSVKPHLDLRKGYFSEPGLGMNDYESLVEMQDVITSSKLADESVNVVRFD